MAQHPPRDLQEPQTHTKKAHHRDDFDWGEAESQIPEELKQAKHKKIQEEERDAEMNSLAVRSKHHVSKNNVWNFEPLKHKIAPASKHQHLVAHHHAQPTFARKQAEPHSNDGHHHVKPSSGHHHVKPSVGHHHAKPAARHQAFHKAQPAKKHFKEAVKHKYHHLAHVKQEADANAEEEGEDDDEKLKKNAKAAAAADDDDDDDEDKIEKEAASDDEDDDTSAKVPYKISKVKIESSGLSDKNMRFLGKPRELTDMKKAINQNNGKKFMPYWTNEIIGLDAVHHYKKFLPQAFDWNHYGEVAPYILP